MRQFRLILVIVLGIWCIPSTVSGQFTETKEIQKRYKISPETRIEISNKYGKIELNTWDNDSVVFKIKIKVEEKKLSKLEKSIESIDFDFTQSQHFLIARTIVDKNKTSIGREILRFKESVLQSDGNIQIDMEVWLPSSNDLKVENKFGDVFIGDFDGNVEINLSNGHLKSHDFNGKVEMTLSFADATINTMKSAILNTNFSEIYIKKADDLLIVSKSSKFEILEIMELDAESRRDNFRIKLIDLLEARGSFSNFRLNELTDRLDLRVNYGDIDIEKTANDYSDIFIDAKSTDINLYFDEGSVFDLEITHTKTELDLCEKVKIEEEIDLDEKEKKIRLLGHFGDKAEKPKTKLNITADSGEINIYSN